jgi:hypothetical protein
MRLAPSDLSFLELLTIVVAQALLLFSSWALLGRGDGYLALTLLVGVAALGLMVLAWDHLPWLHPWDVPSTATAEPR